MKSPRELLEALVAPLILELGGETAPAGPYVKACTDPKFGDFQTNAALVLGKGLKKNPRDVATDLVTRLGSPDFIDAPEIAGPGLINFRLKTEYLNVQIQARATDAKLGIESATPPRTILVDYSSPNVAKELHVGHIRSTILGNAISRLQTYLGHTVIRDNHIGDWGTQFGKVILGYKKFGDANLLETDALAHLEDLYQRINEAGKTDPAIAEAARLELVKLQKGDSENVALWRKFVEVSKAAMHQLYRRLDVSFDHEHGESFYNDLLAGVVEDLQAKGIARESQGAIAIFSDGTLEPKLDPFMASHKETGEFKDSPFLIMKQDEGFLYATTDLATLKYREETFHADQIIYVTDGRQQQHFQQLFAVARRWGYTQRLDHVWFGAILGEDKKPIKTREGKPIKLRALLDEAEERAAKIIAEKRPDFSPEKQKELARVVGLGALKYADLCQSRNLDYVFSWEKLLAFDGNTAPYLQYAYVRVASIFRKASVEISSVAGPLHLTEPAEIALAKKLLEFSDTLAVSAEEARPHYLCNYLYDVATSFSRFFEHCPVVQSDEPIRTSRLTLCRLTAATLKEGLHLLGIETVEEM
jgi:arginyl-tRNA synthetase